MIGKPFHAICIFSLLSFLFLRGGMYLGAVGAYDWSGTVVKYDRSGDSTPDISSFDDVKEVLADRTKFSYLGYAITSGFYNGQPTEYVAVGAPRNRLYGAVVVYRPVDGSAQFADAVTIIPSGSTQQLGSYYGGVLLSTDVNNDGRDDLFVGAPLYIVQNGSNYDDGRVFAYISSPSGSSLQLWNQNTYMPTVLSGGNDNFGGRFGTAIAAAGDLNQDSFNDIIVGAPYLEGNRGAVFVFHGTRQGINPVIQQEIRASTINSVNLQYFGLSLAGGEDLDGNGYPDIAVGAPKSDAVVIFRSRPIAMFEGSLQFTEKRIAIFTCLTENQNRNCFNLDMCLTFTGENIENTLTVNYNIVLDSEVSGQSNKRIEFRENEAGTDVINRPLMLTKDSRKCLSFRIYVKRSASEFSRPIVATMRYNIAEVSSRQVLSAVRDPSVSNVLTASTSFVRDCGSDDVCEYNLVTGITAVTFPPSYLLINGKTENIAKPRNRAEIAVVSEQTASNPIQFRVNLTNTEENAFEVQVAVFFNNEFTWQGLGNFRSLNPENENYPCMVDLQRDQTTSTYTRKLLGYRFPSLGSIMQRNHFCAFDFNISSSGLRGSGTLPQMNVTVYAHTQNGTMDDRSPKDNTASQTAEIIYRADADLSSRLVGVETEVPFNFTEETQTIFSVGQIGENTSDIQTQYEVTGSGHSNIPISSFILNFPYNFPTKQNGSFHILYPINYTCVSETGEAECNCDDSVINPYRLLPGVQMPEITGGLGRVTVHPNPVKATNRSNLYNCSDPNVEPGVCETFRCNIKNLRPTDTVSLRVIFRLWTQSFNLANNTEARFESKLTYTTEGSNLLRNINNQTVITLSTSTVTVSRPFTPSIALGGGNPIWIYIVAAIGGLLLLILIVIILWKTGFFKSKYAEKKEKLEWEEANATE